MSIDKSAASVLNLCKIKDLARSAGKKRLLLGGEGAAWFAALQISPSLLTKSLESCIIPNAVKKSTLHAVKEAGVWQRTCASAFCWIFTVICSPRHSGKWWTPITTRTCLWPRSPKTGTSPARRAGRHQARGTAAAGDGGTAGPGPALPGNPKSLDAYLRLRLSHPGFQRAERPRARHR